MKYVDFKRVEIKNFLSVGESPVVIEFNKGLNIITGNNKDKLDRRNGVGKSTIADALYFALYGNTLRELKKEFISTLEKADLFIFTCVKLKVLNL